MLPALRRNVLAWYRQRARPLPWRASPEPYRVWLSEIMLQQTRVETVIPYFERFLSAFPDIDALAHAPLDRVLKLWEGLGYYSRARCMHRAAQTLVRDHTGRFPRTAVELQQLPGIGRYTAAAIASIAFGEPAAALDGNIKRVLARIFGVKTVLTSAATTSRLWSLADQSLARRDPGDWNQALMELGATLCTPRRPRCGDCPARTYCTAHAAGEQDRIPVSASRKPTPQRESVAAVIRHRGRLLLVRRPEHGLLGGLWEFPKANLVTRDRHAETLRAALRAEWAVAVDVGAPLITIDHAFTHFKLRVFAYCCTTRSPRVTAPAGRAARWSDAATLASLALPRIDQKIAAATSNGSS